MHREIPKTFEAVFRELAVAEDDVRDVIIDNTVTPGTIYSASLVLWGAANRTISQCRGFASMVQDRNLTCASAILRMQLDTVLRLYGGLIYGDIGEYAEKILEGVRVSDLRTPSGKRLFDKLLVKELSCQLPWISTVYERSSGSIHLSRRHVILAMGDIKDDGSIKLQAGPSDKNVGDEIFLEQGQAFLHTTHLAIQMISEWYKKIPLHD